MRLLPIGFIALIGCTSETSRIHASVKSGAPTELVFDLEADPSDEVAEVEQLAVVAYRGRANSVDPQWVVVRRLEGAPLPLPFRVAYGQVPPGFAVARRARTLPLTPGSYEFRVGTSEGTTVTSFRVGRDGRIE